MFLIVGLGNPGEKYQNTPHNIGFEAIDELTANFQFPCLRGQAVFSAKISKGKFADKKVILAKPQTFMNLSGKAVSKTAKFYKIKNQNLVIIHDDIDLPLGRIRIIKNRGPAGHKGAQSIINELGTKNFIRIRLGICPKEKKPRNPERFVLQKFNKEEEKIAKQIIKKTAAAIEVFLKEGLEKTMSIYNK